MSGRGRLVAALLAGAVACSELTATADGVTTLLLEIPLPAEVEAGQTLPLRGWPINGSGDTLDLPVIWRALDTTITVDSVLGRLTGRTAGGTGRIVARTGTLYSEIVTFRVLPRADTLAREGPADLTVAPGEPASPELAVRLLAGTPPAAVAGRRVVFTIVHPVFAVPAERTVQFTGGALLRVATTGSTGGPAQAVTVSPVTGATPPDSAVVEVAAWRPGGAAIPGSGQRFVVRFPRP